MLETLQQKVDPAHAALIVVDVQNDFCHEESPYAGRFPLEAVQAAARRVAAFAAEARRAGVLVIYIQNVVREDSRSEVQLERSLRMPQPAGAALPICAEGSWGADFYCVEPAEGDLVVQKDRYSAFLGNSGFKEMLDGCGIKTLIMTGVTTKTCVESTARDGFMLDYHIVLVDDCCGTYELHLHPATLENITDRFGVVVTSTAVTEAWAAVATRS